MDYEADDETPYMEGSNHRAAPVQRLFQYGFHPRTNDSVFAKEFGGKTQMNNTDKELSTKLKSIVIELDSDEQEKIKAAAKDAGLSVQKYVLKAVRERMAKGVRTDTPPHIHSWQDEDTSEVTEDNRPYMPHAAGEEKFTPAEEAYILRLMRESHTQVPTIGQFEHMSDETQMHTTQRLLAHRKNAIERLMIRRYVEELIG
jgi:uncharacterized protein (DUF1778 family)